MSPALRARFADAVSDLVLLHDPEGNILYANDAACQAHGYPRDRLLGRRMQDLADPEAAALAPARLQQLLKRGEAAYEITHRTRRGEALPLELRARLIEDRGRTLVLAVARGIGERRRAEEEMRRAHDELERRVDERTREMARLNEALRGEIAERRRAEEQLRFAQFSIDRAADGVLWVAPEGTVLYANEAVCRLLGYTREELTGLPVVALSPGMARRGWEQLWARLQESQRLHFEAEQRTKDGRLVQVEMSVNCLEFGGRTYACAFLRDQSTRHEAAEAQRENEANFRELFHRAQDAMAIHAVEDDGPPGRFIEVNDASCRLFGYAREEHLQFRPWDLLLPENLERMPAIVRSLQAGEQATFEATALGKAGRRFPVEVTARTLPWKGRLAVLSIARDLTARRRLEEQLRQAQKMESIGRLAGGVAHDFNNLVTAITGYAGLARDGLPPDSPIREDIHQIVDAAQRAASLTRQLLAFSRRQFIAPRPVDLNELVLNLDRMLRRLIGEDIELVTAVTPGTARVRVDPVQIEQALINLAVNARDAMPLGGRLTLRTSRATFHDADDVPAPELEPGDYVVLEIGDTGHGMSEGVRAHLFEPFFTTKEPGKGTGLGLATVYGILRQHQGGIAVQSAPEQGATFSLFLPASAEPAGAAAAGAGETSLPTGRETILVVEDDRSVRRLEVLLLRQQGYTILEAADAEEALRLVAGHPRTIDLLLTDMVMPRMGGRVLAERLRADRPGLRVLLVSGYTEDAVLRAHGIGPDLAFLEKPFTDVSLARKVREVLDLPPGGGAPA